MKRLLSNGVRLLASLGSRPRDFARVFNSIPSMCDAVRFMDKFSCVPCEGSTSASGIEQNPLREFFENRKEGRGIWKWEHYFDIYHRHFSKFRGQQVSVMEIGIYSGGSLEMWRSYFGDKSHIYGVDIEEDCRVYQNDYTTVLIGDQADRSFWGEVKNKVGYMDILIDDGGHTPLQQQTTLEEMLPHLAPGGVYVCEDIHGTYNRFSTFALGLVNELNYIHQKGGPLLESSVTSFQSCIHSIHFYPYVVVIEKHAAPIPALRAPKHGTEWQPFL